MAKKQPKTEPMVGIYDPVARAFREIPVSQAELWIESAKKAEKEIKELTKEK